MRAAAMLYSDRRARLVFADRRVLRVIDRDRDHDERETENRQRGARRHEEVCPAAHDPRVDMLVVVMIRGLLDFRHRQDRQDQRHEHGYRNEVTERPEAAEDTELRDDRNRRHSEHEQAGGVGKNGDRGRDDEFAHTRAHGRVTRFTLADFVVIALHHLHAMARGAR